MSKFVWESDERLLPGDAEFAPRTTKDLLHLLGVDGADRDAQYQAVKVWLYTSQPDALLRESLVYDGFSPEVSTHDTHLRVLDGGRDTFLLIREPVSLRDALVLSVETAANRHASVGVDGQDGNEDPRPTANVAGLIVAVS